MTHPWLSWKKVWQHQMATRIWKNYNSHTLWEIIWQFLKKLHMHLYCDQTSHVYMCTCVHVTLRYLPKRSENMCLLKVLYKTFLSLVLNSQNLEKIQMAINRNINKLWHIYTMEFYAENNKIMCYLHLP